MFRLRSHNINTQTRKFVHIVENFQIYLQKLQNYQASQNSCFIKKKITNLIHDIILKLFLNIFRLHITHHIRIFPFNMSQCQFKFVVRTVIPLPMAWFYAGNKALVYILHCLCKPQAHSIQSGRGNTTNNSTKNESAFSLSFRSHSFESVNESVGSLSKSVMLSLFI